MIRAAGAGALAVLILAACAADTDSDETLAPVGSAPARTEPTSAGSAVEGAVGRGVVQLTVHLSGMREQMTLDRSTVAAADRDPITLDATCTALDGGDGYVVSIVDVRRLSAGQQLVSATLRATGASGSVAAGEHPARLELGTAQQEVVRFEGVMSLDATLAAGTYEVSTTNGGVATGDFACADDVASLPTTTTPPPVVATAETVTDASGPAPSPTATIPIATS